MSRERIPVEPTLLRWARESMNLTHDEAARKLGVSETTLARWENGDLAPTVTQLRKAAQAYKRPLAVLLLEKPPKDFSVPRDFREGPSTPSPELSAEIRRAHEQREAILDIAAVRADLAPPSMRLPGITTQWDPEEAGEALRAYLAVSLEEQSAARSPRESLATWVSAAEAKGVIVIQTSRVGTDEALGFSVHGSPYPVVAINGSDKWLRRKTFTLFHELAHLSLGTGSICDLHEKRADRDVESYCNSVAAATLLPRKAVLRSLARLGPPSPGAWSLDTLGEVAETFRVSQEATLLRLITLERADWTDWERIRPELGRLYREAAEAEQERMRASSGGPNYYVIKARDIGHGYASTVLDAYHADAISSLDVASYLGIKFQQLSAFEAVA